MNYTFNARPAQQAVEPQDRVVHVTITPAPGPRIVVMREPDSSTTTQHQDEPDA